MFMKEKNIKFKLLKKQIFYIGDFNKMNEKLLSIAKQMVIKGKGILAADESTPTCSKRFESIIAFLFRT